MVWIDDQPTDKLPITSLGTRPILSYLLERIGTNRIQSDSEEERLGIEAPGKRESIDAKEEAVMEEVARR